MCSKICKCFDQKIINNFIHLFSTPMITEIKPSLSRKQSIMSILSGSPDRQSKLKNRQEIQSLISKFNELNNQITIDADQSNFNLIEYQRENEKIKYDPQMMTAKLRKLQNRAEIKRADMQMQNREKSKLKKNKQKKKKRSDQGGYKTIYQKFLKEKDAPVQFSEFSDDQSNNENENNPKTLAFFSKLRSHPKILQFTLKKIQNKNKEEEERKKKVLEMFENHKKSRDIIDPQFQDLLEEQSKSYQLNKTCNPQSVIENQGNKFYSKKSSQNISKEVSLLPRCGRMMQRQNKILSQIDDKSISKENKKKLKNRLNQIIMSIGKSQKIYKNALPKIGAAKNSETSR